MSASEDPAMMQAPTRRLSLERTVTGTSVGTNTSKNMGFRAGVGLENVARRTLGMLLLGVTVFLWTSSNFLASVSILLSSRARCIEMGTSHGVGCVCVCVY